MCTSVVATTGRPHLLMAATMVSRVRVSRSLELFLSSSLVRIARDVRPHEGVVIVGILEMISNRRHVCCFHSIYSISDLQRVAYVYADRIVSTVVTTKWLFGGKSLDQFELDRSRESSEIEQKVVYPFCNSNLYWVVDFTTFSPHSDPTSWWDYSLSR